MIRALTNNDRQFGFRLDISQNDGFRVLTLTYIHLCTSHQFIHTYNELLINTNTVYRSLFLFTLIVMLS